MYTDHSQQVPQQQVLEIIETQSRKRKRRASDKQSVLKRRLNEVITGSRPALKLFSKKLQADVWFINEGLVDLDKEVFQGRIITMAMLAEMMDRKTSMQ